MPELQVDLPYIIVSVGVNQSTAGVNGLLPLPFQVVRLGERSNEWVITKSGPDLYRFAVKDVYPYSGVLDSKVIATIEQGKSTLWYVVQREPRSDAWTIAWDHDHNKVWTAVLIPGSSEYEIEIRDIRTVDGRIDPYQLFRFELVPV